MKNGVKNGVKNYVKIKGPQTHTHTHTHLIEKTPVFFPPKIHMVFISLTCPPRGTCWWRRGWRAGWMCCGGLERDKPRGETRGRRGVGGRVWDGKSQTPLAGPWHHPAYHIPPVSRVTIIPQSTLWTVAPSSTPQPTPWTAARPCHNSPHGLRQSSMPHPSPRSVAPSCHNPPPGLWHHPACHNPPPGPWMIEIFSRLFSIASYMAMGCLSLIPVGVPLCSDRTKGRPCQGEDATPGRPICRPPENHDFDHF